MRWTDYNSSSQSISELIAIDAPSAPLVLPFFIIYAFLIYAFSWGVWRAAKGQKALRIAATLIALKEVFGLAAALFAPMHLRGHEKTLTDTFHIIFTAIGVLLLMFPGMCFAAASLGKKFRIYTILTIILFLAFGALAGMDGPRVEANQPTPMLGIWERINVFGYMLWITVLSSVLLFRPDRRGDDQGKDVTS